MTGLAVQDEAERKVQRVIVEQNLDALTSRDLAETLLTFAGNGHFRVEIDLQGRWNLAAAPGLGALLAFADRAQAEGGFLRLTQAPEETRELLRHLRLDDKLAGAAT